MNPENDECSSLSTKLKHDSALAGYAAAQAIDRRLFDAVITFSGIALKSAILINGGGAVAILAYLGHIGIGNFSQNFPCALLLYTGGVLFGAVATGVTYLTQCCYYYANGKSKWGNVSRGFAIALVILSYICFGLGGYTAYLGFIK